MNAAQLWWQVVTVRMSRLLQYNKSFLLSVWMEVRLNRGSNDLTCPQRANNKCPRIWGAAFARFYVDNSRNETTTLRLNSHFTSHALFRVLVSLNLYVNSKRRSLPVSFSSARKKNKCSRVKPTCITPASTAERLSASCKQLAAQHF